MILGKVTGAVVATLKHPVLVGRSMLLVQPVDPRGEAVGKKLIALNNVQAGVGDTVLVNEEGNSARLILNDKDAPVRSMIVGIVDRIDHV